MLNYQTLLSSYDDKLTLMQWLKKVEAALADASLSSLEIVNAGGGKIKIVAHFDDGSEIESNEYLVPQGVGVSSAYIDGSGHLHLVLTDSTDVDAGSLFNGNVTIGGSLAAMNVYVTNNMQSDAVVTNDLQVDHAATINGDLDVTGDASVGGDLAVTGDIDGSGNLHLPNGNISASGDLDVDGDATLHNLDVDGNTSLGGDLAVTGDVTAASFYGDNAKPIYRHNLEYYKANGNLMYGHILNNNDVQINSWNKFLNWIRSTDDGVVFECSGIVTISGVQYNIQSLYKRAGESAINLIVTQEGVAGYTAMSNVDLSTNFDTFNDKVNKIN